MSDVRKYLPRYTVEDYLQWEGDWELIDGIAVSMAASPVSAHQRMAMKISATLFDALKNEGCHDCEVFYELDWHMTNDTVVRPDIIVVCQAEIEEYISHPPTLIVEILSPSTAEKDRTVKFDLYQSQGVKYFLIGDPDNGSVEVFQHSRGCYVNLPAATSYQFALTDNCQIQMELVN